MSMSSCMLATGLLASSGNQSPTDYLTDGQSPTYIIWHDSDAVEDYSNSIQDYSDAVEDDAVDFIVDELPDDGLGGRDMPMARVEFFEDQSTTFSSSGNVQNLGGSLVAVVVEYGGDIIENDLRLLAPGMSEMELDSGYVCNGARLGNLLARKIKASTGPGGARRKTRATPRRVVTALKVGGVIQVSKPTKGVRDKSEIFKKHIARIPHERKSLDGAVNPLLQVSKVLLQRSEYVAIAREMWPTTKKEGVFVEKTATKNLAKFLCENAMNSDPATSKRLGFYTLTFNVGGFEDTAFKLMEGGNPSSGRPDFHLTVV